MKKIMMIALLAATCIVQAQEKVIPLYSGAAPGSESWSWKEKESSSNAIGVKVIYNISQPTLTVFLPDKSIANGTSVIINYFYTNCIGRTLFFFPAPTFRSGGGTTIKRNYFFLCLN